MTTAKILILCDSRDRAAADALSLMLFRAGYLVDAVMDSGEVEYQRLQEAVDASRICLLCQGPGSEKLWERWRSLQNLLGFRGFGRKEESWSVIVVLLPGADAVHTLPLFLRRASVVDLRTGFYPQPVQSLVAQLPTTEPWWAHRQTISGDPISTTPPAQDTPRRNWPQEALTTLDTVAIPPTAADEDPPSRAHPLRLLVLSAEPDDAPRLHLNRAHHDLRNGLLKTPAIRRVDIQTVTAARRDDLSFVLNHHEPHVLHFMGHGGRWEDLLFENAEGRSERLAADGLVALFSLFRSSLRLIYLDACFTKYLGERLAEHIPCVVGMRKEVTTDGASAYCAGFYRALGFGRPMQLAHEQALAAVQLYDHDEITVPKLLTHPNIDPDCYVLLPDE